MEDTDPRSAQDDEALGAEETLLSAKLRLLFRDLGDAPEPECDESTDAPGPQATEGRVLGDFRLLRRIGAGGMATVFEAEQLSLHRRVALKVLAPHLSFSSRSVRKFQREAEAGGRPVHPGIVAIHAVGEHEGVHFIAEELVGGGRTLADQVAERGPGGELPLGWFRLVAGQLAEVADALAHAHACEVIHRDVKPSNILLAPDDRPKVGDFGLARVEDALALSRSGDLAGTPYYMSPEQALGKRSEIDHRTDVYSLGVTLYECLTLRRPFAGDSTDEVLSAILLHDPPDPRRLDPRVPGDLSAVCMKAMEKDPRRRYATMQELAEDLRRFHAGEAVRAQPVGRLGRAARWVSRRRLQVVGGAVALLAAGALVVLVALLAAQRDDRRQAAEARFVPLREALWQGRPGGSRQLEKWHARVDPGHPDGPMLAALAALAQGNLGPAAETLQSSLELCGPRRDEALARDARYLLSLVDLELARAAQPSRADALRAVALRQLQALEPFDPLEGTALAWRDRSPGQGMQGLRLDGEHRLVHLYLGVAGFEDLYKGGSPEAFRDTVAHLEAVLAQRPDDEIVTGLLGRALLFEARTYDQHQLLPRAAELCRRANERGGASPFYLWSTTLGQIRLLHGDGDGALEAFRAAQQTGAEASCDSHNVPLGFGRAYALLGRPDEAQASLEAALGMCDGDPHSLLALAELCFTRDPARALECARTAWRRPDHSVRDARAETGIASAALAVARLHVAAGRMREAQGWLRELADRALPSPRDFGQACRLALTLPQQDLSAEPDVDLGDTVRMLAQYLEWTADPLGSEESAITWSGIGAARLHLDLPGDAIEALERAQRARERWPDEVRAAHWPDDACDLFALGLAHHQLAALHAGERAARLDRARAFFDQAELLVLSHAAPWEQADVLERLRAHVRSVLEGS